MGIPSSAYTGYGSESYSFNMYGTTFKYGTCAGICINGASTGNKCYAKYVAPLANTDKHYCKLHYKIAFKEKNLQEKKKMIEEKKKAIEEKKKAIEEKKKAIEEKKKAIEEKKKLFDEKNAERVAKGLPTLKRMVIKKQIENVVQSGEPISTYKADTDDNNTENIQSTYIGCSAIIKSGPNKGKPCGCQKIKENGLCLRHLQKNEIN